MIAARHQHAQQTPQRQRLTCWLMGLLSMQPAGSLQDLLSLIPSQLKVLLSLQRPSYQLSRRQRYMPEAQLTTCSQPIAAPCSLLIAISQVVCRLWCCLLPSQAAARHLPPKQHRHLQLAPSLQHQLQSLLQRWGRLNLQALSLTGQYSVPDLALTLALSAGRNTRQSCH